jgi:hypothetical protein
LNAYANCILEIIDPLIGLYTKNKFIKKVFFP